MASNNKVVTNLLQTIAQETPIDYAVIVNIKNRTFGLDHFGSMYLFSLIINLRIKKLNSTYSLKIIPLIFTK